MYLTFEQKNIMVENVNCLLNFLGKCWIITNINVSSIVQFDPFSQLHPNKILKDYVQFKGFQTYPFESVVFAKRFF
jgi:hypothetical protein